MRFWDSSAIVPLLVAQARTSAMRSAYGEDPLLIAWWGTSVECVSALVRLERDRQLTLPQTTQALRRLDLLAASWQEVQPGEQIRVVARRLLRSHSLRAADAMQLAAAWTAAEEQPATLVMMCLDDRLGEAAEREGFDVRTG